MLNKIIFPESDEAATYVTKITGWVSREGFFYGKDEQAARWEGATHLHCEKCGAPTSKSWTICGKCREQRAHERYIKLPIVRWDKYKDVPVYSLITNQYYWCRDEVRNEDDICLR